MAGGANLEAGHADTEGEAILNAPGCGGQVAAGDDDGDDDDKAGKPNGTGCGGDVGTDVVKAGDVKAGGVEAEEAEGIEAKDVEAGNVDNGPGHVDTETGAISNAPECGGQMEPSGHADIILGPWDRFKDGLMAGWNKLFGPTN